ncbi:unnamed protein product [Paramecium octaurelia]|uniref:Uncharacterized protein n=1 Tax=Paramecium octaurelia TaxID=43137 RepID=A0A8S1RYR9_PAROT|nr:unnamed protein product [Paramecium octaurelia]
MYKRNKELKYEALKELQKIVRIYLTEGLKKKELKLNMLLRCLLLLKIKRLKLKFKKKEEFIEAIRQCQISYQRQWNKILSNQSQVQQQPIVNHQAPIKHQQAQSQPDQKIESVLNFEENVPTEKDRHHNHHLFLSNMQSHKRRQGLNKLSKESLFINSLIKG